MLTIGQLTTTPIAPHGAPPGPVIRPSAASRATVLKSIWAVLVLAVIASVFQTARRTSHIGVYWRARSPNGISWTMLNGSPSPISADASPWRAGFIFPVWPLAKGISPINAESGPLTPLDGVAASRGV